MQNLTQKISEDQTKLTGVLSYEENVIAIHCAEKVLGHLRKHNDPSKKSYETNILLVEQIIKNHKSELLNGDRTTTQPALRTA